MQLGLRIDVDTLRGTRLGVPNLCRILRQHNLRATFFFSVGPDNMGRHVWRLFRPAFLLKMVRTRAPNLYGWGILRCGTLLPGPRIGERAAAAIREASESGHEIGFHAWDHHAWQVGVAKMPPAAIRQTFERGIGALREIAGVAPSCSAAPAWRCTDEVLLQKEAFPFRFNADCRGESIFLPMVRGRVLDQPQIPTTLPTYDESIGRNGVTPQTFNEFLLSRMRPDGLNVVTLHAEVEGIVAQSLLEDFLSRARERGFRGVPLGELLQAAATPLPVASIRRGATSGREGWIACQAQPAEPLSPRVRPLTNTLPAHD